MEFIDLGTLTFLPGETEKSFSISIIDDDIFEEDEHFYAKITNLRVAETPGMSWSFELPVAALTINLHLWEIFMTNE